jgi:glycine hydroxymethyltransferase
MHVIAAKTVAFGEALQPEYKEYQQQVIKNAKALAKGLIDRGFRIVSGGTDNHLLLVDLRSKGLTGKVAEKLLVDAEITCNKNGIPNDPEKPWITSGIRLGTPAVTTRGMKEKEMDIIAELIARVLDNPDNIEIVEEVKKEVNKLGREFPLYK